MTLTVYILEGDEKPEMTTLRDADIVLRMTGGQVDRENGTAEWGGHVIKSERQTGGPVKLVRNL